MTHPRRGAWDAEARRARMFRRSGSLLYPGIRNQALLVLLVQIRNEDWKVRWCDFSQRGIEVEHRTVRFAPFEDGTRAVADPCPDRNGTSTNCHAARQRETVAAENPDGFRFHLLAMRRAQVKDVHGKGNMVERQVLLSLCEDVEDRDQIIRICRVERVVQHRKT